MAQLEKKFFGSLKGALGDVVFRSRNEKNFISQKPKSYTPPDTPEFKERTGKFKIAVKLASAIYSLYPLKQIWNLSSPAGKSAFNYLVQVNYPFVEERSLSNMIKMVPRSSFGVTLQSLTLDNLDLNIQLAPLTDASNINLSIEKEIQIFAVIFMGMPVNPALPQYDFLKVSSVKQTLNLSDPVLFSLPFRTADTDLLENYTIKQVLFTALTFNENDSIVQYSSTISNIV